MFDIRSPASGTEGSDGFDDSDEFVADHLPEAGPFLEGHGVLRGAEHVDFHRLTEELFEDRGVYDVTFGYNLARLNLDRRHPDAGYRYAVEADEPAVIRAEFSPTTAFCPQSETLTTASFHAWNGECDRHGYELVRVRVHPTHQRSDAINEELSRLESEALDAEAEADLDGGTDRDHPR